ncbi:adenosylmethionine-8-amino-7-oxononanoate aminotransferase [Hyphomicrobium nitrativorans NL23]|uniref:Adenosylmethionine-8-amino-7-oxononanoate aminotransferase n=1 Tax=Hyphomicrobium nitrativorans NL23 TaxID=1029756 RepID=V5SDC6_9HYPH|nr:adenosylmethionine--8-amino-7-oxononanoate transaminase [Hyphomicrobium nitrativorans]AHB47954.1 adenosylmethionine-8-amino-7-oxononanoate aminotransferase [Hyphomicrobium nitrativorans NL23]
MARTTIWHPFTQHGLEPLETEIMRAKGAWLETTDNRRILDAISSWWVVTHGHRHPAIVEAIKTQADRLDQVIFAGFTHPSADALAYKLVSIAPPGLAHVFFSDSGSTSVEVALKMALGYWRGIGEPRTRIAALEHGYHGDTIGTMSAGSRGLFNATYEPLLFDVVHIPFPVAGREQATLDALDAACRDAPLAALVVEPLIAGAGGMKIYSAATLAEMKRICAHHGALLIADEVMTGWGRTGTLFACEQAGITPDIMCLAKGITGGSLPLAATLASPAVYDAHFSEDRTRTLFHSSSFTANAICCAAALANIGIWEEESVLDRIAAVSEMQLSQIAALADDARFANPRCLGTIGAIDLRVPDGGYLAAAGPALRAHFLNNGVLLRPLGNTIYVMPPYCVTADDLARAYGAIREIPAEITSA